MPLKEFFKSIKKEVKNEITRQIGNQLIKGGAGSAGQKVDISLVENVLGFLGNDKGSSNGMGSLLGAIQKAGGYLPGDTGKLLPGILKVAEVIGHGIGDDAPRNDQNSDGSFVDGMIKTIVGGRKIHGGKSASKVKPMDRTGTYHRGVDSSIQDYQKIKEKCLSNGSLFEDDQFPAHYSSIFFTNSDPRDFEWLRPHEISKDPRFFVEGASRFDVKQGELGDCWLLAAIANLTLNEKLFHQIVPEDNSFQIDYCGLIHFRFWQYGRWVDVVIDDRLPTYKGKLVFMHSADANEFWSALLEKAYAKLHGCYEALKGGTTCEALEDFTGGVTEMYDAQGSNSPKNLFTICLKAHERSSFMGCSIEPDPNVTEAKGPLGLIKGHAYSITDVKLVDIQTPRVKGKIQLLRIRNPWGNAAEWNGSWSDGSKEWEYIDAAEKSKLGLIFEADGEFWMSLKEFTKYFQRVEICNLSPHSLEEDDGHKRWNETMFEGAWIRGATAGGCRNYIETFAYNPQYLIELTDVDQEDDEEKCTVIVALMQKNRRAQRKLGMECLTIGFAIYALPTGGDNPRPLPTKFFKYNASVARSPTFINLREVSCRFKLPPGSYVIVPSCFEPNQEGEFIIRVFSESKVNLRENDGDVGLGEIDERENDLNGTANGVLDHNVVKHTEEDEDKKRIKVKKFFKAVAGDDMEIDWSELKEVLDLAMKKEFKFGGFSRDVCRSMVALMDVDRSGKLGLDEFIELWGNIRTWKEVFQLYDKDASGHLNAFELRQALSSAGYSVNNKILETLVLRYGDKFGQIVFDDFIMCAVKLKCMMEIFKERDTENTNHATFSLEEWVDTTLYS